MDGSILPPLFLVGVSISTQQEPASVALQSQARKGTIPMKASRGQAALPEVVL